MNTPINCRNLFLVAGIVLIAAAMSFRGYVEYQKRVHNLNLQIGHSLAPVVPEYISWSKEEPLKPGELPKRGEFYTYRRPESAAKTPIQKFYQRLSGGRLATKQCHGVSEDGLLWDTGSDDRMIPVTDIVGHVIEIYDSRYKELSKTPEGRFRLWVERHHLPEDYQWIDNHQNTVVVVNTDGNLKMFSSEGTLVHETNLTVLLDIEIGHKEGTATVTITESIGSCVSKQLPEGVGVVRVDAVYQKDLGNYGRSMGIIQLMGCHSEYYDSGYVWVPTGENGGDIYPLRNGETAETERGTRIRIGKGLVKGEPFHSQQPSSWVYLLKADSQEKLQEKIKDIIGDLRVLIPPDELIQKKIMVLAPQN